MPIAYRFLLTVFSDVNRFVGLFSGISKWSVCEARTGKSKLLVGILRDELLPPSQIKFQIDGAIKIVAIGDDHHSFMKDKHIISWIPTKAFAIMNGNRSS
jgi:hypothetical protein